jgi:hypothetical protein
MAHALFPSKIIINLGKILNFGHFTEGIACSESIQDKFLHSMSPSDAKHVEAMPFSTAWC